MINGFDYSRYLREKKISGIVKLEQVDRIGQEKEFKYYLFKFKGVLLNRLAENYSKEEAGFLKAILLGETSSLDEEIKENFKNASVSHILAISGMHISYIVLGIEIVLKLFVKNIKIRNIIIIMFLILFAIFIGESNSVFRACMMTSIVYLGKTILKKDNFFASFKVALFVLLIINPYNIFSGAMWLSFGGSLGIVLYSKFIEKMALKMIFRLKHFYELNNKFIVSNKILKKFYCKIISIISVTVGAQIVVFPIMLYIFNTFSINFIISNLLISELIVPILIFGYLSFLIPVLSFIEKIMIKIILFVTKILSQLPLNQILLPTPKLYKVIIYYAILGLIAYFYNNRKMWFSRKIRKIGISKTIFILIFIITILFVNINLPFRNNFEIHFLDVGQGDSCLIRTTSNKTILIDGGKGIKGEYDYGKNVLGPYLLDHGITKLNYVIVSHFDSDHCRRIVLHIRKF